MVLLKENEAAIPQTEDPQTYSRLLFSVARALDGAAQRK
jgi:hypothetical protein